MNREQKAAAIDEIAAQIEGAQAVLAVDYRGISVPQVAELRAGLRQADASFRVVKNSLTERAADKSGAETLKPLLTGPTALAFVRGDIATAAKTIADYGRATQLLAFKGGLVEGAALDVEQIRSLSRLPSREVLYGQLVGVVASPVSGLVRSLGALLGGLAVALGQVREKMQSGELPSAAAPLDAHPVAGEQPPAAVAPGDEQAALQEQTAGEAEGAAEPAAGAGEPADGQPAEEASEAPQGAAAPDGAAEAPEQDVAGQTPAAQAEQDQTEPAQEPAQPDDEAEASSEAPTAGAEEKPAKED
jgi:large subunit ribosomal protein L10